MSESRDRQAYLDWMRGVAVLIMIEARTFDSWTRVADRRSPGFANAMILGGFGAPFFLFLAGVSVALSAGLKFRRTGLAEASSRAFRRRGWQIFGLAWNLKTAYRGSPRAGQVAMLLYQLDFWRPA